MNTTIPYWIAVLQGLSTPAIALLATVIGVMQWRTSHQRAVLDLFEKRLASYDLVWSAITPIVQHGTVSDEMINAYIPAMDRTKFLFGPEVYGYLRQLYHNILDHQVAEKMVDAPGQDRTGWVNRQSKAFEQISKFYDEFEQKALPYMRMPQKMPPF
jgi:hypothetical protein